MNSTMHGATGPPRVLAPLIRGVERTVSGRRTRRLPTWKVARGGRALSDALWRVRTPPTLKACHHSSDGFVAGEPLTKPKPAEKLTLQRTARGHDSSYDPDYRISDPLASENAAGPPPF